MNALLTALYSLGFLALSIYGLKVLLMTLGYLSVRHTCEEEPPLTSRPTVTVQLPIFNERYVAARAIGAACRLRWPRDRLEIQVLDDSTDATREVVDTAAAAWRSHGLSVTVLRRDQRSGFKAGALAQGTARARGDVLAVLDADFVPAPDFLERTVRHLQPGVAAVQARWGHLNARASGLTHAQAVALDGHFVVEQTARARLGLFVNFNGTAGIWRREAIEAAGGWQGDTLSEDIDLSFRAQLAGWRVVFLPEVAVPAELPTTLAAFRCQQRRWATGTTQLLLKLGPRLGHARLRPLVRLHALFSLSEHLFHLVTLSLLLASPLLLTYRPSFHIALGLVTLLSLSPALMYAVALAALYDDWPRRLTSYPLLAALAVGLSLNGAVAVLRALLGCGGAFQRTPKFGNGPTTSSGTPGARAYHLPTDAIPIGEAALAAYAWLGLLGALVQGVKGLVPLFAVFAVGYTVTCGLSLLDTARNIGLHRPETVPIEELGV